MEYRIKKDENGYIAEIGKENRYGKVEWIRIENDNLLSCNRNHYYDTVEEAETACRKHHIEKGYNKEDNKIIKTFTL